MKIMRGEKKEGQSIQAVAQRLLFIEDLIFYPLVERLRDTCG